MPQGPKKIKLKGPLSILSLSEVFSTTSLLLMSFRNKSRSMIIRRRLDNMSCPSVDLNLPCVQDLHRCGDCLKEFDSFEAFLIHKLLYEKYKLKLEPSKRITGLRIPTFIKSPSPDDSLEQPVLNESAAPSERICSVEKITDLADYSSRVKQTCSTLTTQALVESSVCDKETNKKTVTPTEIEVTAEEPTSKENEPGTDLSVKVDCHMPSELEVDEQSDDNVSVWSQAESLRIDESANIKDNLSSPHPECQLSVDNELNTMSDVYCQHCDNYYKNKVVLRVHKETVHSGHRPFPCRTCRRRFKSKGSLVRHERIHTGERPYSCRECGKAFHESGSLRRHVKRVHHKLLGQMPPREVKIFVTQLIP